MQPNFRNDITMLAVGTTVNTNSPSQESANNDPKNTLTLLADVALQAEASETSASSKAPETVRIKERLLRNSPTSTHKNPNTYVCHYRLAAKQNQICGQTFPLLTMLTEHRTIHANAPKKPVFCPICNQACQSPSVLKIHERKHTGEKPFTCKHCKKSFVKNFNLTRHIRNHNLGNNSYDSPSYTKSYSRHDTLIKHQFSHHPLLQEKLPTGEPTESNHIAEQQPIPVIPVKERSHTALP